MADSGMFREGDKARAKQSLEARLSFCWRLSSWSFRGLGAGGTSLDSSANASCDRGRFTVSALDFEWQSECSARLPAHGALSPPSSTTYLFQPGPSSRTRRCSRGGSRRLLSSASDDLLTLASQLVHVEKVWVEQLTRRLRLEPYRGPVFYACDFRLVLYRVRFSLRILSPRLLHHRLDLPPLLFDPRASRPRCRLTRLSVWTEDGERRVSLRILGFTALTGRPL